MTIDPAVRENIHRHDQASGVYDEHHSEIFNPTEQRRLGRALDLAIGHMANPGGRALDFGAGTGNLTGKLLGRGFRVRAVDVSRGMLAHLEAKHAAAVAEERLQTTLLDGSIPLPFGDGSFDLVCAYSVLHHVPDYLRAVAELTRVTAPGGVLYLDHESNEDHWRSPPWVRVHRVLTAPRYAAGRLGARALALFGREEPPLPPPDQRAPVVEGDIHIYQDDHIEWERVREVAEAGGISDIVTQDYLLCRETGPLPWRHWLCRRLATDMRLMVGRAAR